MKSWKGAAAIGLVFAAALFVKIDAPFLRHREVVGAYFAVLARNQVRLGSYEVSCPRPDSGVYPDWRIYAYANRPFVGTFVTSLWFRIFGDREWVVRLSLIFASLGSLFAFFKLAERLLDADSVVPATALFAFTPMFWYFSVLAVHLVYALCFSLAAWACWVRAEDSRRHLYLAFGFLFLACESDWPGYYAALSLGLDAFFLRRRGRAAAVAAFALACFGLHVLHLLWIDPAHGPLLKRFLSAGAARTVVGMPGPFAFLWGELREGALYFTVGGGLLALVGMRNLPRRVWLLALLGLDEVVFMRWAHVHDYLTYPLAAFFALAAARGLQALWTVPGRRLAAGALLALAAAQSLWITGSRLIREGAYEINYRAGVAIHEGTGPEDRVLITIADERQFTPYYADRYSAGVEVDEPFLMIHPSGPRFPVAEVGDLEAHFKDFSVVLVGDPDLAAKGIRFFKGQRPPEAFRFLGPEHPLRRRLESIALSKVTSGAFVLYRLR
ncbi:MAG: glycosyltransferase family 39 protein [Planctomycetes bacterium]|nr:glycosyltransferase family 39 protein [Planctomycetota bacterium]